LPEVHDVERAVFGVAVHHFEFPKVAVLPLDGANCTADPERSVGGFQNAADIGALPGGRKIELRLEGLPVKHFDVVSRLGAHPERAVSPGNHQSDGAPQRMHQRLETLVLRVEP